MQIITPCLLFWFRSRVTKILLILCFFAGYETKRLGINFFENKKTFTQEKINLYNKALVCKTIESRFLINFEEENKGVKYSWLVNYSFNCQDILI